MSSEKITLEPQVRDALAVQAKSLPIPEGVKEVAYLGCDCFGRLGGTVRLRTPEQVSEIPSAECPAAKWAPINEPVEAGDRVVVLRRLSQSEKGVGEIRTVSMAGIGGANIYVGDVDGPSGLRLIVDKWIALGPEDAVAPSAPTGPVDRKGAPLAVGDRVTYHDLPAFNGVERPELDLQVFTVMAIRRGITDDYVAELDNTSAINDTRSTVFTQRLERTGETGEIPTTEEEGEKASAALKDAVSGFIDLLVKAVDEQLAERLDSGEAKIIEVFDIDTPEEKAYYAKLPDGWHEVDSRVVYQDGADFIKHLGRGETYEVLG